LRKRAALALSFGLVMTACATGGGSGGYVIGETGPGESRNPPSSAGGSGAGTVMDCYRQKRSRTAAARGASKEARCIPGTVFRHFTPYLLSLDAV
jgi:hypothetical protein